MLRLLFDENIDHDIVRGLRRRRPGLALLTVQEAGLAGLPDPELLAWAAAENRILVTHDVNTITLFAYERLRAGEPLAGVFLLPADLSLNVAIEQLILHLECSDMAEWLNQVHYLPL